MIFRSNRKYRLREILLILGNDKSDIFCLIDPTGFWKLALIICYAQFFFSKNVMTFTQVKGLKIGQFMGVFFTLLLNYCGNYLGIFFTLTAKACF